MQQQFIVYLTEGVCIQCCPENDVQRQNRNRNICIQEWNIKIKMNAS